MNFDFVFRLDANSRTGAGHLMRCLAVIERLYKKGWRLAIVGEIEARFLNILQPFNIPLFPRSVAPNTRCIIVDHYDDLACLLAGWGDQVSVILFEDLNKRSSLQPRLVINALGELADLKQRYPQAEVIAGVEYLLFRQQVEEVRLRQRGPGDGSIVVSLGGSGQPVILDKILRLLTAVVPTTVNIHLYGSMPNEADRQRKHATNIRYHQGFSSDFIASAAQASIVISAAGQSLLEMVYCGIPVIGIVIAENQKRCAQVLMEYGVPVIQHLAELDSELPQQLSSLEHGSNVVANVPVAKHADQLIEKMVNCLA